ncbi:hypothetical protein FQN52_007769 [Onygenales sp. PD_12]|nr:hypothetical protein FQN52_007769 [Onygenales sp. PD_12]
MTLHDRIRELEETFPRGAVTGPIFTPVHAQVPPVAGSPTTPGGSRQAVLKQTGVAGGVLENEREAQQDLAIISGPTQAENESPRRNSAVRVADDTTPQTAVTPSVNEVRMADTSPGNTSGTPLYDGSGRVTGMGQISGPGARLDPQSPPQEFYGASSTASFMRLARASMPLNQPHKAISDHSVSNGQVTYQFCEPVTQFRFEDFALPPRSLADNLLQCFWDHIYCLYPFFDRPGFEAAYENLWKSEKEPLNKLSESNIGLGGRFDSGPKSIVFHCALNLIFALGVVSMTYGRPSMTSHLDSVPLPDTVEERQGPSLMTFYATTIRLYKILDDILSDVYNAWRARPRQEHSSSRNQWSFDTLIELERRLCTYESDLPPFLNWTVPSLPEQPRTDQSIMLERQRNVLHGRYNYLRLLLYRPIFIQLCSEANSSNRRSRNAAQQHHADTSSQGKFPESLYSGMANKCAAACVLAAVDLIQLVYDTHQTTTTDAWWYNGFYTSTAATVLIMSYSLPHILDSAHSHTTIVQESWSKCETILSHMATFSPSARNTLQFLQAAYSSQLDPSSGRGGPERDAGNGSGGSNQIQEQPRPTSPSQAAPEEPAAQHHHPPRASASAYEAATILSPPINHQNEFSAGVAAAAAASGQGGGGPFGPLVTEELGFLSWMDTQDIPGWMMGDFRGGGSAYG